MKTAILTFALLISWITMALAVDSAYENAMLEQLGKLKAAKSKAEYQAAANAFERIGNMNADAWHPPYYTAFAYAEMALTGLGSLEEKDALLEKALEHIEKAAEISPSNSEIIAMRGYIIMGQLSADPESRGQSLSPVVLQTFGKAMELDNTNPRAMALMAQMEYGMSQFFGQGTDKACRMAKASLELFEKESETAPSDKLHPTWGREMAEGLGRSCR
jgi:tetratricopeptide (TPR) repeat protein